MSQNVTAWPAVTSVHLPGLAVIMRPLSYLLIVVSTLGAAPLAAQSVAAGASLGTAKLTAQRSEQAFTGVLQLPATSWLTLSATPSVVHVKDVVNGRAITSNGLADLPLSASASKTLPGPSEPTLAAALTVDLPTGNAACGLGSGQTSAGLDVGFELSPGKLHLSADASRSISNVTSLSTLSAPRATSLLLGGGYDVASDWRADASLGFDLGQSDSTQALSRMLGGGLSHDLGGSLELTLDGSVGLTSSSPKWVLTIGIGSAFSSTSPVSLTAPLKRLRTGFTGSAKGGKSC